MIVDRNYVTRTSQLLISTLALIFQRNNIFMLVDFVNVEDMIEMLKNIFYTCYVFFPFILKQNCLKRFLKLANTSTRAFQKLFNKRSSLLMLTFCSCVRRCTLLEGSLIHVNYNILYIIRSFN